MFSELVLQRDHWILVRGLFFLFVLATPINLFVGLMGGGSPDSKGFFYSLGIVLGMELLGVGCTILMLKVIDSILIRGLALQTFSYLGLILASGLVVIGGNIWVDNLYQFKQGNYGISIIALFGFLAVWAFVVLIGHWKPW